MPAPAQSVPPAAMPSTRRSQVVLNRAAFKLVFFTFAACLQTMLGYSFVATLANMTLLTGLLSVFFGVLSQEKIRSPYWTFFDEAAWFILLGHALLRFR